MIGAGIVGTVCAWHLTRRGHQVLQIAPPFHTESTGIGSTASHAALGLLMAHTFHRHGGRAWRLRQRSLTLWRRWERELRERGHLLRWREGLLLLAADADGLERQRRRLTDRQAMGEGAGLEIWGRERLETLCPAVPTAAPGGLHSPCDGQLDPGRALATLQADALANGLRILEDAAVAVEGRSSGDGRGWGVGLEQGGWMEAESVVLAAGVEGGNLLRGMGQTCLLEPVLGQAVELELSEQDLCGAPSWPNWPGAVAWQGINLVPRPDLPGGRRLWLGATLEPGRMADPSALNHLLTLHGEAPDWLRRARRVRRWQGLRPRPVGRPAPVLEEIAPGLLLTMGHYRNGVLLAAATAEWVTERIEAGG